MPGDPSTTLRIERLDGGLLEVDGWGLASRFFALDPSSVGVGSYDSLAGTGVPDRITADDVGAINRTMRARSKFENWRPVLDRSPAALGRADVELDLVECDDAPWEQAEGQRLVAAMLTEVAGPYRGCR